MQYIRLKEYLKDFTVFSLGDIKKLDRDFHRRRLNEWQDKGYINKVVKGYYIFSDLELNENILFEIANRIYAPSYISFEMALSYYHLIPESVYHITSATSRRTYKFATKIGSFNYRTVNPKIFFGYDIISHGGKHFKIASIEKAVIDYFYLNPQIKEEKDFSSLRFGKKVFLKKANHKKLKAFLKRIGKKSLSERLASFLDSLN
ncbi:MAG: hypothetical protein ABH872_03270 [Candidatus Omnitrophota bacterium]